MLGVFEVSRSISIRSAFEDGLEFRNRSLSSSVRPNCVHWGLDLPRQFLRLACRSADSEPPPQGPYLCSVLYL
jgi:hypothetical protein